MISCDWNLKFNVYTKYKCPGPRINVIINAIRHFRVKSIIPGYHQRILNSNIYPEEISNHLVKIVPQRDMIHFQEISTFNEMIAESQAGLIFNIQIHCGLIDIPKDT